MAACGATQTLTSFGGAADLWGLTWTPAEINAAGFAVRIRKSILGSEHGLLINWIRVTVTYTAAAATTYNQSAYKWYANVNSSTVGAELTAGAQDASTTLSAAGDAFRLRMLLHVGNATATVAQDNFKLQYASTTPGNCLPGTYGSLPFVDVPTSGSEIAYKDNAALLDGAAYASTSTDPTHGGDIRVTQTYEEANNFTVTSTIGVSRDGQWDFSLVASSSAPAATTYCFRAVKSDGTLISTSTSSKIPEIKTASTANTAPTVSSAVLNGGSAIILTPNATTAINLTAVVSDTNGCSDITGGTTTAMIYRSGITSSTCQSGADNQFCYVATAFTASSTCSGGSINATTFGVWYFAQATDASSSYGAQNWKGTVIFKDPANATGSADSSGVELETLLAITVTTSSINYGALTASSTSSSTNQIATTTNVGNSTNTYSVRASATLTKGTDSIATSNQRWATSTFNYDSNTISAALTDTAVNIPDHIQLPATSTAGTAGRRTFWGLRVPSASPTGTYSGVTEYSSVWLP